MTNPKPELDADVHLIQEMNDRAALPDGTADVEPAYVRFVPLEIVMAAPGTPHSSGPYETPPGLATDQPAVESPGSEMIGVGV